MENDINKKNTPNQMRILMKRMRDGKFTANESKEPKKDLDMRDMLKITRRINESSENKETVYDQSMEEEKFRNFFKDMEVHPKFINLEVYDDLVFWGGVVDGIIKFVYTVTPDETTSKVEFDYSEDFSPDNPENDLIIEKLEEYYNIFYKYWRNNMIQQ